MHLEVGVFWQIKLHKNRFMWDKSISCILSDIQHQTQKNFTIREKNTSNNTLQKSEMVLMKTNEIQGQQMYF